MSGLTEAIDKILKAVSYVTRARQKACNQILLRAKSPEQASSPTTWRRETGASVRCKGRQPGRRVVHLNRSYILVFVRTPENIRSL